MFGTCMSSSSPGIVKVDFGSPVKIPPLVKRVSLQIEGSCQAAGDVLYHCAVSNVLYSPTCLVQMEYVFCYMTANDATHVVKPLSASCRQYATGAMWFTIQLLYCKIILANGFAQKP